MKLLYGGMTTSFRAEDDTFRKIGLNLEAPEKRFKGKLKRWLDTLPLDPKIVDDHQEQALDRENWHHHTSRADAAIRQNDR